jgi:hypothetical protein
MQKCCTCGSVRGALGNQRPYRDTSPVCRLIRRDFQFAGFGRQMGFPPPRGGSNADVYLTGKQSRSFANSTGPEYRFLISDRV